MGFRLAIMQSFAVLASAFSGLISFGVFQINEPAVKGWQWLFIIEGAMTLLCGLIGFRWLPDGPSTAWFLTERERAAATARLLRDTSSEVDTGLNMKECFQSWNDWKFPVWCLITFTYPVAYATAMNFFPLVGSSGQKMRRLLIRIDRSAIGLLGRQDEPVDSRPEHGWCSGAACSGQVLRLLSREDLPHRLFLNALSGGHGRLIHN